MEQYSIESSESNLELSTLEYNKINKMIKQKDSLIVSLKDTVTNLSNIIITSGQNLVKVNDSITSNIDASFLDKHMEKMESYIKHIHQLELENTHVKRELSYHENESNKVATSYNILNELYIDLINDLNTDKSVYTDKINNLSNTIDSIKLLHDDKTKSIRSYYRKQLSNKSGIECQKCFKEKVTTIFLPCKHMVLCNTCYNTYCENKDLFKTYCYKCNKAIEDSIEVNFD